MFICKFENFKFNADAELALNDILDKMSNGGELSDLERFNLDYISKYNEDILLSTINWFKSFYHDVNYIIEDRKIYLITPSFDKIMFYDQKNPGFFFVRNDHFDIFLERFNLNLSNIIPLKIYKNIIDNVIFDDSIVVDNITIFHKK